MGILKPEPDGNGFFIGHGPSLPTSSWSGFITEASPTAGEAAGSYQQCNKFRPNCLLGCHPRVVIVRVARSKFATFLERERENFWECLRHLVLKIFIVSHSREFVQAQRLMLPIHTSKLGHCKKGTKHDKQLPAARLMLPKKGSYNIQVALVYRA